MLGSLMKSKVVIIRPEVYPAPEPERKGFLDLPPMLCF